MIIEKDILKGIGKRIRHLREAKGFSQPQLSHEAEVDHGTISKIELGKVNPGVITIIKLAIALKCEISDIINLK